jgi:hypothetical protein
MLAAGKMSSRQLDLVLQMLLSSTPKRPLRSTALWSPVPTNKAPTETSKLVSLLVKDKTKTYDVVEKVL